MILSTHAVIGSSISYAFGLNPVSSFISGFLSHFIFDLIPHWDYHLESSHIHPEKNHLSNKGELLRDLSKIFIDFTIGVGLSVFIFHSGSLLAILAGAFGAMSPDFMHLLYSKFPNGLIVSFYKFHTWIHSDLRLDDRPILGPTLQIMIMLIFIYASIALNNLFLPHLI